MTTMRKEGRLTVNPVSAASRRLARVRALFEWRRWTVSVKLAAMLAVPVAVALVAGGGLVWHSASANTQAGQDEQTVQLGHGVQRTLAAVRTERALTSGATGQADADRLDSARAEVDVAVTRLRGLLRTDGDLGRPAEAVRGGLVRIDEVRGLVVPGQRIRGYSEIAGSLLDLAAALPQRVADRRLSRALAAVTVLSQATEHLAQQQSLVDLRLSVGALGREAPGQVRDATALAAGWLDQFSAIASSDELAAFSAAVSPSAVDARNALVTRVIGPADGVGASVDVGQWRAAGQPVVDGMGEVVERLGAATLDTAGTLSSAAGAALRNLVVAMAVAVLAAGAVIIVLLGHVRRTSASLRAATRDIATTRLPELLVKVRDGRARETERPRLPVLDNNEFGAVALAFDVVCGEAIAAAAEQARMRSGYSDVFGNMFMRSQSLIQRQLHLIERLEEEQHAPEQLAMLYQLDHLVTRARRNNENVLVLSGTELVRKSTKPVPLAGVLQAAISEIEQYQRVELLDPPSAKVIDSAASDLIRMLAELLDNATSFSAPETKVTVQGQVLRDGSLSIAIVDNGIGMSDEEIHDVNDRLTRLGSTELAKSRRVGLLVVGRLAGKHGFGVELLGGDRSAGVTAVISVPAELLIGAERPGWADRRHAMRAAESRRAAAARHEQNGGTNATVALNSVAKGGGQVRHSNGNDGGTLRRLVAVDSSVTRVTGEETGQSRPAQAEQWREELIRQAHANVPDELPLRTPNGLIGKAGADGKSPAERVRSAWFGARDTAGMPREVSVAAEVAGEAPPRNWISAADEGWHIVETVSRAPQHTYTEDGLPMRRRGAHLVPGSVLSADRRAKRPIDRDPGQTRSRLSGFQQGVRKARGGDGGTPRRSSGWKALEKQEQQ